MYNLLGWMAIVGIPVLAVVEIGCLIHCRGKGRLRLTWAAAIFLGALALLAGGNLLLGCFGLAWRNAPAAVFFVVLLLGGCAGIILTLACFLPQKGWPDWGIEFQLVEKGTVVFLAIDVLLVTLWTGLLIFAFVYSREERIVEYQGQILVEVDNSWHHPSYYYYEYHGPLVRGSERIYYCERKPLAGG